MPIIYSEKIKILVWTIYDISNDRIRTRVSKLCKNAGLYRVQKSVFLGGMQRNRMDELHLQCEELIDDDVDSIYLFPMCDEDFKKVKPAGNAFDKKLVTDEVLSVFF